MMLPTLKVGTYLKWYGLYGKFAEYSNSLAAMAKEKGLQPMPLTTASTMRIMTMLSLIKMLSSLTGLKVGGVITLHLLNILQARGTSSLTLTETGTISSVKNLKMVEASSRKLSKTLKKLHSTS